MNQLAQLYKPALTTSAHESIYETMWKGGESNVNLEYLIDQVEDTADEFGLLQEGYGDFQHTHLENSKPSVLPRTFGNKIVPIAERLNAVISELPIESARSPYVEVFQSLQEWEGVVLNISDSTFTARLVDVFDKDAPDEEADFLRQDLRNDDFKMLEPGAVFRWVVGYVIKKDGTKRRSSDIVFRRLPQWTQRDISEADEEARSLLESVDWL